MKKTEAFKHTNFEHMATFKFFKINKSIVKSLFEEDEEKIMLALVDVSQKILYDT